MLKNKCIIILLIGLVSAVDYQSEIQPIWNNHCGNCHLGNSSGGLNLSNYDNLMSADVIVPGNHMSSELYDRITRDNADTGDMPPGGAALTDEQISLIAQWIDEGALEEEAQIEGCTDPNAITCEDDVVEPFFPACDTCSDDIPCENYYNEDAVIDNGLCMYNDVPAEDQFTIDEVDSGFDLDWSMFAPPVEIDQYTLQRCVDMDSDGDGNFDDDEEEGFEYENCVMIISADEGFLGTTHFDEYTLENNNPMKYTLYVGYPNNIYWGSAHGYYYYDGEITCTLGDVNLDGIINVIDIVTLVNFIFGSGDFDNEQLCAGDLNGDGIINVIDIVNVVNIILS
tara:strand:+ start:45 stop:1064 length:1020 start_codon:yes stop_codon:yes gene_type:complete